jgi:hypothetical protein
LTELDEYKYPDINKLWTATVYDSFDLSKAVNNNSTIEHEQVNNLKYFPEKEIFVYIIIFSFLILIKAIFTIIHF